MPKAKQVSEFTEEPEVEQKPIVKRAFKPAIPVVVPQDGPAPEQKQAQVFTASNFSELPLNNKLKEILAEKGFETLTAVQKNGIPALVKERNVVLKSETGSGKTLAYLVPLLEHLSKYSLEVEKISREKATYAIIFSPTRELCT